MVIGFEELPKLRIDNADAKIVFAGGCYDLVHEGHVEGLEWRKSLGDILVVGVSSDQRVAQRKGEGRPLRTELGRLSVVDAFKPVDYSLLMPMPTEISPTMQIIHMLKPDVFVDYHEAQERWASDSYLFTILGVELVFDTLPKRDSTTAIIERASSLPHYSNS